MPLAAILFDKDGTLVDFDRTWGPACLAVMRTLAGTDGAAFDRIATAMQFDPATLTFRPTSPLIAGASADYVGLWADALGRPNDAALLAELDREFATETLRFLQPIGDPLRVLKALRARRLRLGLATNDSEVAARTQMAALKLDTDLEFIVGYDSGYGSKPGSGMVYAFAAFAGVPPADVAVVGDAVSDLSTARAAGAIAVAVLTGPAGRAQLEPSADHVIPTLDELPALTDRLRSPSVSSG